MEAFDVFSAFLGLCVFNFVRFLFEINQEKKWMMNLGKLGRQPNFSVWRQPNSVLQFLSRFLNSAEKQKRQWVFIEFPEFLDYLGLNLSSGLTVEQSWKMAVQIIHPGPFQKHMQSFSVSLSMGCSIEESLREVSRRMEDHRIKLIFSLISQSVKSGGRLQPLMHEQAAMLRSERLNQLEKSTQTASLRMLFPLFLFIFPTIFIVIFAPLIIRFSKGGAVF